MMRGVAQVIGMKPTLRSFFSIFPLSCAIASSARNGKMLPMAAIAAGIPTARRKRRRSAGSGKSARSVAPCSASAESASAPESAEPCSAAPWSWPQGHCLRRSLMECSAFRGLSNPKQQAFHAIFPCLAPAGMSFRRTASVPQEGARLNLGACHLARESAIDLGDDRVERLFAVAAVDVDDLAVPADQDHVGNSLDAVGAADLLAGVVADGEGERSEAPPEL